jgi:NAD(P) transhydrogenase subunit alpha
VKIGVPKERVEGEQRVALVPETVSRLAGEGFEVLVESGAGRDYNLDEAYEEAGARIVSVGELYEESEMILKVQKPTRAEVQVMPEGTVLVCFLQGPAFPELAWWLAKAGVTVFSVEAIPRTSRSQGMDALSAMESVTGYKSVMIGAQYMLKNFPEMSTTVGTTPAAKVLVLGAGVSGLRAAATAKSLGADVTVFDARAETKDRVESLGATFLEEPQPQPEEEEPEPTGLSKLLSTLNLFIDPLRNETATKGVDPEEALAGADVYARLRSDEEQQRDRGLIREVLGEMDLVISTVLISGQRAPILLTQNMVGDLRPGSVIVDLAAESGGNCEPTEPGRITEHEKVKVIGPVNVPGSVPAHASQLYSHSMFNFLGHITQNGELALDFSDQITDESCIAHNGEIRHGLTVEALQEIQKG